MIGKPGDGFKIAMSVLDVFRSIGDNDDDRGLHGGNRAARADPVP